MTNRKQVLLHESDEQYRAPFNNLSDAVFLFELNDDGTTGRIIEVNDSACRMLNYTRGELLLKSRMDIEKEDSHLDFSHGICPDCAEKYRGEFIAKRGR